MTPTLTQPPLTQIKTHVLDAINQLLSQYREGVPLVLDNEMQPVLDNEGNPILLGQIGKIAGRVYIFAQYIQREENIKWAILTQTSLANAVGATLDRWGILLNVTRSGLADAPYRQILQLVVIEYTSQGNIETLIQVYKIITGASIISLFEFFPGKFQLTALGGQPLISVASISNVIQQTKAGGIGYKLVLGAPGSFGFKGNPLARGFPAYNNSNVNLDIGGQFAGAIS